MVIIASTTVVVVGAVAIEDTQDQLAADNAENAMTQLDSEASLVALGAANRRQVSLGDRRGNGYEVTDSGELSISVPGETIPDRDLGTVVYEQDSGTTVAYQGGGVWRSDSDGSSVMVSPPQFHYENATLTLPLVTLDGDSSVGDTALVSYNSSSQVYPNVTQGRTNPVESGPVQITITSEYADAWERFFKQRTDGGVTRTGDQVTLTLTVPANNPPVGGGIVAGSPSTSLEIKNNAIADSYNSSNGDYSSTEDDDTRIVSAGSVIVKNNARLEGSVESEGDVTIDNNGEVTGNVAYGGTLTNDGTIGGWDEQNGSVVSPDSVERLIDDKKTAYQTASNNGDPSVDVDEGTNTLENCGSICEVSAGNYYLSSISLNNGDTFQIDASSGSVNIFVDGDITLQNNANIILNGNNRVNIYTEGDVTFRQNSYNSVPGDRSPNFWIYTNPDSQVDFDNNVMFTGVLYGPGEDDNQGADISVDQNAQVFGGLVGDVTFVSNRYEIHYDEALANTESVADPRRLPELTYLHVSTNDVNVTSR
jgi:hypothetical protein